MFPRHIAIGRFSLRALLALGILVVLALLCPSLSQAATITSPSASTTYTTGSSGSISYTHTSTATVQCQIRYPNGSSTTWANCKTGTTSSSWSASLGGTDGNNALCVRSGTSGTGTCRNYFRDRAAPGAPTVSDPGSSTTSSSVSFTITSGSDPAASSGIATNTCQVGTGSQSNCSSSFSYTFPSAGTYTFNFRTRDNAGNVSAATTRTITYSQPTCASLGPYTGTWGSCVLSNPSSVSLSPQRTTSSSTLLYFTPPSGATAQCRNYPSGGSAPSWASCSSPYTASSLLAGWNAVEVRSVHTNPTTGTNYSSGISLLALRDNSPPTLTVSTPTSPTTNSSATFTVSAIDDDSMSSTTCTATTPAGGSASCGSSGSGGTWTYNFAAGYGTYNFTFVAQDQTGNQTTVNRSVVYQAPTTPPGTPTINSGPLAGDILKSTSPSFSFSASKGSATTATFYCQLNSSAWTSCGSGSATTVSGSYSGTAQQGSNTFRVYASGDGTSPTTTRTWTVDSVVPNAPTVSTATSPTTAASTSFTVTAGADPAPSSGFYYNFCTVTSPTGGVTYPGCNTSLSYTFPSGNYGTYTFTFQTVDVADNYSSTITRTVVYEGAGCFDTYGAGFSNNQKLPNCILSVPTITSTTPIYTTSNTGSVSFALSSGATGECQIIYPNNAESAWTSCTSPSWSTTLGSNDGLNQLLVRQKKNGFTSNPWAAYIYKDTTAPAAPVVSNPSTPTTHSSVNFTITDGVDPNPSSGIATNTCRVNNGTPTNCGNSFTYNFPAAGTYNFYFRTRDNNGNLGPETTRTVVYEIPDCSSLGAGWGGTWGSCTLAAPTNVSLNPQRTASSSTSLQFTTASGASAECRSYASGANPVPGWTSCSSPWTVQLPTQDWYVVEVRQSKPDLNAQPVYSNAIFRLALRDSTPPNLSVSTPSSPTNDTSVSFAVSSSDNDSMSSTTCQVTAPVAAVTAPAACGSTWTYNFSAGSNTYNFSFIAEDQTGNKTTVTRSVQYQQVNESDDLTSLDFTSTPNTPNAGHYLRWTWKRPINRVGSDEKANYSCIFDPWVDGSSDTRACDYKGTHYQLFPQFLSADPAPDILLDTGDGDDSLYGTGTGETCAKKAQDRTGKTCGPAQLKVKFDNGSWSKTGVHSPQVLPRWTPNFTGQATSGTLPTSAASPKYVNNISALTTNIWTHGGPSHYTVNYASGSNGSEDGGNYNPNELTTIVRRLRCWTTREGYPFLITWGYGETVNSSSGSGYSSTDQCISNSLIDVDGLYYQTAQNFITIDERFRYGSLSPLYTTFLDRGAPAEGTVSAPANNTTGSFTVNVNNWVDKPIDWGGNFSGMDKNYLQRRSAPMTSPTSCGTFSAWSTIDPGPTVTNRNENLLSSGSRCYQYQLVGLDKAANLSSTTSNNVIVDLPPPAGGAISVPASSTSGSFDIGVTNWTDSGLGMNYNRLERRSASLVDNQCGTNYSDWSTVDQKTNLFSTYRENRSGPACYQYRLVGVNLEGKSSETSPQTIKVDTTAPVTAALDISAATGNTLIADGTVYINPQAGRSGSFQATINTASDPDTTLKSVKFPGVNGFSSGGSTQFSAPFTTTYTWSGTAAASANSGNPYRVLAINGIDGENDKENFTITPDTVGPALTSIDNPSGTQSFDQQRVETGLVKLKTKAADSLSGPATASFEYCNTSDSCPSLGANNWTAISQPSELFSCQADMPGQDVGFNTQSKAKTYSCTMNTALLSATDSNKIYLRVRASDNVGNQSVSTAQEIPGSLSCPLAD